jgi:hypothetical protein
MLMMHQQHHERCKCKCRCKSKPHGATTTQWLHASHMHAFIIESTLLHQSSAMII